MSTSEETTRWRASGSYLLRLASKTSLLEESRQFLQTYARLRSIEATRQELVNGGLPQRSRATRQTILEIVQIRLVCWNPPTWVLDDLVAFAQDGHQNELQAALLLHSARQDNLLYDIIQQVLVQRWIAGERELIRADIQRFLDTVQPFHPEVAGWSHATREKLSSNALAILHDFGLLQELWYALGALVRSSPRPVECPRHAQHQPHLLRPHQTDFPIRRDGEGRCSLTPAPRH